MRTIFPSKEMLCVFMVLPFLVTGMQTRAPKPQEVEYWLGTNDTEPISQIGVSVAYYPPNIATGAALGTDLVMTGSCIIVFTESEPGARDWWNTTTSISTGFTGSVGGTRIAYNQGTLAIDATRIYSGAYNLETNGLGAVGGLHIFTESAAYALDWEANRVTIINPAAAYTSFAVTIQVDNGRIGASSEDGIYIFTEGPIDDWSVSALITDPDPPLDTSARESFGFPFALKDHILLAGCRLYEHPTDAITNHNTGAVIVMYETSIGSNDWMSNPATVMYSLWVDGIIYRPEQNDYIGNWGSYLGTAVAISDDHNLAFSNNTGAPTFYYNDFNFNKGEVRIDYGQNNGGGAFLQESNIVVLETPELIHDNGFDDYRDCFGYRLAFYELIFMVSAPVAHGTGGLYLFHESGVGAHDWNEATATMLYPVSGGNGFGNGMVMFDNVIAISRYDDDTEPGLYVQVKCETVDRWSPCDCTDTPYTGLYCEEKCDNGAMGYSSSTLWGFPLFDLCDCTGTGAVGTTCSTSCNNGFSSADDLWSKCNCTGSGATGKFCTKDTNDCESNPCSNGGTCTDDGDSLFPHHSKEFNCTCPADSPYSGVTCSNTLCVSSPCLHGASCRNGIDFVCNCTASYEGEFCETEVDECASSPCLNDGLCTDLLGDFTCVCAGTGYEGETCDIDLDDCLSSPCQNDGVCQDKGANKFKCNCNEFWEGSTCSDDVDDCLLALNECLNGGACEDDPNVMGDVICTCIVEDGGFTGKYCEVPVEDACVTFNPCFNGGKCILNDTTKAMSCDCTDTGYEGGVCDVQVYFSECLSSPCMNGGQCYDPSDEQDDWYCDCDDTNGYFGDVCEFTACDSMPCRNSGTCIDVLGGDYTCTCAENYSGPQCEVDENKQVGVGSSSSSSSGGPPPADTPTGSGTDEKEDSSVVIIVVIIVVFLFAVVGGALFFFYRRRSDKFVMPT